MRGSTWIKLAKTELIGTGSQPTAHPFLDLVLLDSLLQTGILAKGACFAYQIIPRPLEVIYYLTSAT